MRISVLLICCWFYSFSCTAQSSLKTADIIIKEVTIIPIGSTEEIKRKSVAISKGIITDIGDFKSLRKDQHTQIINGKDKFLLPGLTDMHIHLPVERELDTFLALNIMSGVTRMRVMNSKIEMNDAKNKIKQSTLAVPKLYYSYPFYSNTKFTSVQTDSIVQYAKKAGYDFIKVFSLANDTVLTNLMMSASKYHMIICGHYPGKNVQINKVLASGYRSIEHLGGYEAIKDEKELTDLLELTKDKHVFNCPTLDWQSIAYGLKPFEELKKRIGLENTPQNYIMKWDKQIAENIQKNGLDKLEEIRKKGELRYVNKLKILKQLNNLNALLLVGSDPESYYQLPGFSMYEEMLKWNAAGLDNYTILRAAIYNPAIFFGEENNWGSIAIGKQADLLLLTKNPIEDLRNLNSLEITFLQGNPFYKSTLRSQFK